MIKFFKIQLFILLALGAGVLAFAGHLHSEKWYQERWCSEAGGQVEVVLQDQTRCDCLTRTHAVEFDFAAKWAEAIGQSLYYSLMTGKRAGIVLILESEPDEKYLTRLDRAINAYHLPIDVWVLRSF